MFKYGAKGVVSQQNNKYTKYTYFSTTNVKFRKDEGITWQLIPLTNPLFKYKAIVCCCCV